MYNIKGDKMIYFDYAATTPVDKEVLETYIKANQNFFGNSTALHKLGIEAEYMHQKAKQEMFALFKLEKYEAIYTMNATEANNIAIFGVVRKAKTGRIITTCIEHPSVKKVMKELEKEGYDVIYLNVNEEGLISLNDLEKAMTKDTLLVSIIGINNIVGSIQNIKEISKIVKKYPKAKLHVDLVQAIGRLDIDFEDIDLFTFSSHKIYGLKGLGVLCFKNNIDLVPILYGSSVQLGLKPGTLDVPSIIANTKALKLLLQKQDKNYNYVRKLNLLLRKEIEHLPILINSPKNASPYILNISLPNLNGETAQRLLEEKGFIVGTGSSCSSKTKEVEPTLYAMFKDEKRANNSVRISFSYHNKESDVLQLTKALKEIVNV
jgi:cysteine desulfurase